MSRAGPVVSQLLLHLLRHLFHSGMIPLLLPGHQFHLGLQPGRSLQDSCQRCAIRSSATPAATATAPAAPATATTAVAAGPASRESNGRGDQRVEIGLGIEVLTLVVQLKAVWTAHLPVPK